MLKENPNATAAAGTGTFATVLVGVLSYFGVELDPTLAVAASGLLTAVVLLVGRKGIAGLASQIWRGSEAEEE